MDNEMQGINQIEMKGSPKREDLSMNDEQA